MPRQTVLLLCLVSAAFAQPKHTFPIDTTWGSPLFIQVQVNGSPPMRFALDSASTWSMIRKDAAAKLGLKPTRSETASGGGGQFQMDFAPASLQMGDLKLDNVEVGVTTLSPYYEGLLGADLFEKYVVTIDYAAGRVSIYEPDQFRPEAKESHQELTIRGRIPCLQASVLFAGKEAAGEFRVDTGSGASITMNAPFAAKHGFPPAGTPTRENNSGSLGGSTRFLKARADAIRIGDLNFDRPIVQAYVSTAGSGGGTVLAGHIGNAILSRFRVTFDCPHRRIYFLPNAIRNDPFELDMSGIGFGPDYRIAGLQKDSVAEAAGLRVGDVIVSVEGKPVSELGLEQSHQLLARDGTERTVEVRRGDQTISVKLALKRLF